MDFNKTEEQELLLEGIDEFFAKGKFNDLYIRGCEARQQPLTEYKLAAIEAGFGLLGVPEEFGGVPVDTQTLVMVAEKIGSHGYPSGLGALLQVDDILAFGTPEQQKNIMDCLMAGDFMGFCLGLSEPQAGSDSNAITASFTRKNGKVYISGHKTFITDADRAKYMLCMTRDFNSKLPANQSMTTWLVPMNFPGVKVELLHKVGHRTRSFGEVYLDNVEIEEKDIVGKEGQGFLVVMKNFEVERLVLAADSLGMAACAYNDALKYATQRQQFGVPIGSFQMIQEKIVIMKIKIENMRNFIYKTAWEKDNGYSLRTSSALCKLYCAQAGFEVVDDAMQVLGGIGYTDEHRVSRLWRDARMHRIGGGTDQIMVHIAGRALQKEVR
ncbi:MAG: acyl-CoA dehydrogenase [Desulfovibrio sp.]|jgi:alkylation response protein AidB-like acyl-CoA dehydrogenase|nr:acyl-CoA dehydrogenase [Desulfovibrio sp.]